MFSIFLLVGFAVALGLALAVFITRGTAGPSEPMVPPEEEWDQDPKDQPELTLDQLYSLAEAMCARNQLVVKDRMVQDENEVYWVAESQNDFFFGNYVVGFFRVTPQEPFVKMSKILEFKDFIKSAGSTKGLFFTTGYFTRDVHQPLEGPKVSLYNRLKVLNELKNYQL